MIRLVTTRRLRGLRSDLKETTTQLEQANAIIGSLENQIRAIVVDLEQQLARAEQGGAVLARTVDVMAVLMRAAVRDGDLGRAADGIEHLREMVYDTDAEAPAPLDSYASGADLIDAETAARDGEVMS